VYIKGTDEKLTDAATGEAIAQPPSDIDNVRLNNRLRGMVGGMIGGLPLMSPDAGKRYEAAQSVYRSRDAGALPALEKALEAEQNQGVKRVLAEARAAILIGAADTSDEDRLAAVDIIRGRGGQDALNLLAAFPADAA